MNEEMVPAIILPIMFGAVVYLVKILSDNKVRHRLIDKGVIDENIKYLFFNQYKIGVPGALKWGMVLIGVGLAFLIGQLVPGEMETEVTIGCIFLLAGLGMMIYYFIERKIAEKQDDKK